MNVGGTTARRVRALRRPLVAWRWKASFMPSYVLAGSALLFDVATSVLAAAALAGRGVVWLWRPWLALDLTRNPGATLGMLAGHPRMLTLVAAAGVILLAALVAACPQGRWGLALMLGGAAGNLASRLATGGVVLDFLQVRYWPGIFNPADVFLRAGAVCVVLALLRSAGRESGPGLLVGGPVADDGRWADGVVVAVGPQPGVTAGRPRGKTFRRGGSR